MDWRCSPADVIRQRWRDRQLNFLVGVISPIEKHEPTEHLDLNNAPVLVKSFIHGVREAT